MSATPLTAQRGLLAGLLTLIAFASAAVAMTARQPATPTTASSAAQAEVRGHDDDGDGRRAVAFGERDR